MSAQKAMDKGLNAIKSLGGINGFLKGRLGELSLYLIFFSAPLSIAAELVPLTEMDVNPRQLSVEQLNAETKLEREIDQKVRALIKKMAVEEKVGQMTQITLDVIAVKESLKSDAPQIDPVKMREAILKYHVGSILNVAGDKAHSIDYWHKVIKDIQDLAAQDRLKIPVLYGIDSIHGAQYTTGATVFPQSINMAATWEPDLLQRASEITALETRISGIPWNFMPVLDVGRQVLWPRLYETYGEDVLLAERMGRASIIGQQGLTKKELSSPSRALSCMKHYVGYSFPWSGKDRTPAIITERMMREQFLPPFAAAVKAGSETVMINSAEVDGIPGHANYHLITEVLKGEMKFKGFAVSDWEDIKRLHTRDRFAASPEEAVRQAVMAGVDMSMVPFDYSFAEILVKLVNEKKVPMSRIDDAVARILRVKYLSGIFENPYPMRDLVSQFGDAKFQKESRQMAAEGLTLLKNEKSTLPLSRNAKVLVTGPTANSLAVLNGGWTLSWQGSNEALYPKDKKTILQAIKDHVGASRVSYHKGVELQQKADDYEAALKAARNADIVVLCLGEKTYTETPGNIEDLTLDTAQLDFARELYKQGTPVVLVLVQGRPRVIREIEPGASAILMAYLPGMEGAAAIADTLYGVVNPSGKLPFTYPRYVNSLLTYDHKQQEELEGNTFNPQWPFGFGLSYSKFVYKNLRLSQKRIEAGKPVRVTVEVSNDSDVAGKEVVQLYVSDLYRSYSTPPVKKLADFKKISLAPRQSAQVDLEVTLNQLGFWGPKNQWGVERGQFKVQIQNLEDRFEF
jgi:beta-glucosidase